MTSNKFDLKRVQSLVGHISREDLRYIDSFVGNRVAMFMPQGGACFYALTPLHSHPSYMFVLPFNDETVVKIDGRLLRAEAGKLSIYSPGVQHQELPSDVPPRYIAICIEPDLFENEARHYTKEAFHFRGETFPAGQPSREAIRRFMQEADGRMPGSESLLSAIETELCHAILRDILHIAPERDRISVRLEIDRVIEYLHENLSEKINIESMASVANMSRSHFIRSFKQETGSTPMEYLATMRLERAKKLLGAGEMSIAQAALASGFSNPSYLTERFTRRFGLSPSEYRKSIISKEKDTASKDPGALPG